MVQIYNFTTIECVDFLISERLNYIVSPYIYSFKFELVPYSLKVQKFLIESLYLL